MALATRADVEAALRRSLQPDEDVDGLLEEASDLVVGYLHPCPIPDPTPPAISRVVASMVAAAISRTPGLPVAATNATAGPYGLAFAAESTSLGPYFTNALKQRLRPYRCGNGMVSVQLASERA